LFGKLHLEATCGRRWSQKNWRTNWALLINDHGQSQVIVLAEILIDRGNVFLAVTIAHQSYLFGNLVKNVQ
jgi:hypothetical protein